MVTTIIFDLPEVFLSGLLGTERLLENKLNVSIPNKIFFIPEIDDFFHGVISEDEYWEVFKTKHGLPITVRELKELVRSNFKEIDGTRSIIETLRQRGYKLGLLSIHSREWIEHCEKEFDFHKLFDSRLYSFEVAICKPEHKAYQILLDRLLVKPAECLFIDDTLNNLIAAEELGMVTVQFQNAQQLKKDLIKLKLFSALECHGL